jgi:hypothetical protein
MNLPTPFELKKVEQDKKMAEAVELIALFEDWATGIIPKLTSKGGEFAIPRKLYETPDWLKATLIHDGWECELYIETHNSTETEYRVKLTPEMTRTR